MTEDDRAVDDPRWHLAAIEHALDDAVIGTTVDGTITSWSQGAQKLYGYRAEEARGRHISLLVPPGDSDEFRLLVGRVVSEGDVIYHRGVRRNRSGDDIEVEVRMGPVVDDSKAVAGVVIIDRDLSEQRWVAVILDATLARMGATLGHARAAEEHGRHFLADAAHQLRSPLATVRVCAEGLLQASSPDEADRLLGDLVRQTARAGRLISSLLRIARLDQGEELAPGPCDVVGLCRDEADRMWHLAPQLNIVLRGAGIPSDPPRLDQGAVREIMANLLENAVRHAQSEVQILISAEGGDVELRVIDDGPGLRAGDEERAFERFVTLDAKGGSGLGLPIARHLARAHGGDLVYEGGGFLVRLAGADPAP